MEHYPSFDGRSPAQGILTGFGLQPDSPFIRNSAAYHARESAPGNSLILQRVEAHRSIAEQLAQQQRVVQALRRGGAGA